MFPVEGDRWLVTLAAFFDNSAPQDHDGFLAYARSLTVPDLYHAIRNCEPVSGIRHYRFAGSVRKWFERLRCIPEGLIAIGDAVCSFNPVYGQGMTVAAIEAELLGSSLARAKAEGGFAAEFAARWFRGIAPIVDGAWGSVRLEDFSCPELAHECPLHLRLMQWYMGRVHRATQRSAFAADRFYRVMNFLEPGSRLFDRRMMAEVLAPRLAGSRRHALTNSAVGQPGPVGRSG
jgi:2-polyprenyl-6-methoxyphenol hydroxylase-like FAD-dependent oxidoreductase